MKKTYKVGDKIVWENKNGFLLNPEDSKTKQFRDVMRQAPNELKKRLFPRPKTDNPRAISDREWNNILLNDWRHTLGFAIILASFLVAVDAAARDDIMMRNIQNLSVEEFAKTSADVTKRLTFALAGFISSVYYIYRRRITLREKNNIRLHNEGR